MAWHNGKWWPLYKPEWYSPNVSQFLFDPYSFTHVLHGLVLYYLWQAIGAGIGMAIIGKEFWSLWENVWVSVAGFMIMFIVELGWEVLENSKWVIERFRKTYEASPNHVSGDSRQNIIGDLISCQAGFCLTWFFSSYLSVTLAITMSAICCVLIEISLLVYMRDNGTLIVVALMCPNKTITKWHNDGVEKARLAQEDNCKCKCNICM